MFGDDLFIEIIRFWWPKDVRCVSSHRYKRGSSSLRQNVITKPKHVAGPTPHKVQSLEAFSTVSYFVIQKIMVRFWFWTKPNSFSITPTNWVNHQFETYNWNLFLLIFFIKNLFPLQMSWQNYLNYLLDGDDCRFEIKGDAEAEDHEILFKY